MKNTTQPKICINYCHKIDCNFFVNNNGFICILLKTNQLQNH